jgi:hypothetical protein
LKAILKHDRPNITAAGETSELPAARFIPMSLSAFAFPRVF